VDWSTGGAFQLDGLNRSLNVIAARARATETLGATGYSQSIDPRYNTDRILTFSLLTTFPNMIGFGRTPWMPTIVSKEFARQ
jgi:hypothetical protein